MADGLTVPFALAAGLTAAVTSSRIIVTAGLAEIAAGAIAMGLGGYLAARTDQEHYLSEEQREYKEIQQLREVEIEEVASIFRDYGVKSPVLDQVTNAIAADPKRWVDFMMRFELGLERTRPQTGTHQRYDNRRVLYRRRTNPSSALHFRCRVTSRTYLLRGSYWHRSCYFRSSKGKAHRDQHGKVGSPNHTGRRSGRYCRIL